jgi:hypothetical protein
MVTSAGPFYYLDSLASAFNNNETMALYISSNIEFFMLFISDGLINPCTLSCRCSREGPNSELTTISFFSKILCLFSKVGDPKFQFVVLVV